MNFFAWIISWFWRPATTTTTTPFIHPEGKMKRALCFGINDYPGDSNDLQGCVNDVTNWANLLKNQYGFNTKLLTDKQVTLSTIKSEMTNMITNAKSGDSLVITYSGHGTSVVDIDGDETDGKDEAICLISDDGKSIALLLDDDIRGIFNKLPTGVNLLFVSDSCFSGSVTRAALNAMSDNSFYSKPRYLPPEDNMEATQVMMLPSNGAFASPYPKSPKDYDGEYTEEGMNHVLLSGANDSSYSYDTQMNGENCGAFSFYAIKVLKGNPKTTYNDFYTELSKFLPSKDLPQYPQLEGSVVNKASIMFE